MNYNYYSLKVIDGQIKAVVNKGDEPQQNTNLDDFSTEMSYDFYLMRWKQNHEVFEFVNQDEIDKVFRYFNEEIPTEEEVTCIEIKDGLAFFKSEVEESQEYNNVRLIIMDELNNYTDENKTANLNRKHFTEFANYLSNKITRK